MLTCSKTYRDIPLGHRQPLHGGRCSYIHGHNWSMKLTFAADKPDSNGFIVDFGKLHYIREWIDENLDHACAFSSTDPQRGKIEELAQLGLLKPLFLENPSCEGLAQHLFKTFDPMVRHNTDTRAWLLSVELEEDSRNSVLYRP